MCKTAVKAIMVFQKTSHLSELFICMEKLPVYYLFISDPFLWPLFQFAWMYKYTYKISTPSPITLGKFWRFQKPLYGVSVYLAENTSLFIVFQLRITCG